MLNLRYQISERGKILKHIPLTPPVCLCLCKALCLYTCVYLKPRPQGPSCHSSLTPSPRLHNVPAEGHRLFSFSYSSFSSINHQWLVKTYLLLMPCAHCLMRSTQRDLRGLFDKWRQSPSCFSKY